VFLNIRKNFLIDNFTEIDELKFKKAPEVAFLSHMLVAINTTKLNNNVPKDLLQCT